jgi:FAD dependent oxidoreductase
VRVEALVIRGASRGGLLTNRPPRNECGRCVGIIDAANFASAAGIRDVTLVNWPQIDYWLGPLVGDDAEAAAEHERRARQLSLSFLYWMQTEAPCLDGGSGYAGLRLRSDIVGETTDGLAMSPYIRESRRILGETRIVEHHVGVQARGRLQGAETYPESVGVGSYRIDLHPSTGGPAGPRTDIDVDSWPYQIPLGALVPVRIDNLLPAAKNIATTDITNGCTGCTMQSGASVKPPASWPRTACGSRRRRARFATTPPRWADFQRELTAHGVQLAWSQGARHKRDLR